MKSWHRLQCGWTLKASPEKTGTWCMIYLYKISRINKSMGTGARFVVKRWGGNSNTLATWCEELTCLKNWLSWYWQRLKAGEEGDNGGWDGWMASPTQWTWVWVNSGSRWWTGRPGVLQSMELQRVGHNWATELNCGGGGLIDEYGVSFWGDGTVLEVDYGGSCTILSLH